MALTDSLISYWTLDEASGTRNDSHGTNNLTDNGSVGSAAGKINNAADFEADLAAQFLSHADNAPLSTGDIGFTLTGWGKFESLTDTRPLLVKGTDLGDDSGCEYALYGNASSELHFRVGKVGFGFGDVAWSSTLSDGTWYFFAVWHDAASDLVGISVNAGTAVTASWTHGVNDTANPFRIGGDGGGGGTTG